VTQVLQQTFPGEKFEFMTLMEPHKAHQGSVAMLRRLDPEQAPDKYRFHWGREELEEKKPTFDTWDEALQRY
jgi:hypothetical protein